MDGERPGGLLGAITARADAQVLRLSVAYALAEGESVIDVQHLQAAWGLWSYCAASARMIFGDSTGNARADRLLAAIRTKRPDGLDRAEWHRVLGGNLRA